MKLEIRNWTHSTNSGQELDIRNSRKGYIALYTVLMILAVSLIIGATVTFLSIGEAQSGFAIFRGEETLDLVEGCTEDVLQLVKNSYSYAGGTVTNTDGSCTVTIDSKTGTLASSSWTISIVNAAADYTRTIQVILTRTPTGITVTSWKAI